MFRGSDSGYVEQVDVIGNKAFLSFVEDLEKLEDLELETFEIGKDTLQIITITPVKEKMESDIGIPELSPLLVRKKSLAEEIALLDVMAFRVNPLPLKEDKKEIRTFVYEGRDILTDEKLLEREYTIPSAQTAQEVLGYYARRIAENIKLPAQFAALVPKIREFFEKKAFGKDVQLEDPVTIKAMSSNLASYVVTKEFERALRDVIVEERKPALVAPQRLISTTQPYPFSKLLLEAKKSVFNYVACDNEFERNFAKFLAYAGDVLAFAKLPEQFGFCIEYTDAVANLRHYYPDFVLRLEDKSHWLVETKGREDIEVKIKDEAAENWCSNATTLTSTTWRYLKVPQKEFEGLHPSLFEELAVALLGRSIH